MRELVATMVALWLSTRTMRVCMVERERDGELVVVIGD
jgi:hypothetical protein